MTYGNENMTYESMTAALLFHEDEARKAQEPGGYLPAVAHHIFLADYWRARRVGSYPFADE